MKYILIALIVLLICILLSFLVLFLINKLTKKKIKKAFRIMIFIGNIILLICVTLTIYVSIYYHADKNVKKYLNSSNEVVVTKIKEGYFFDGKDCDKAIIFYPGAKVEYTSYAPLMYELALNGYDTFLIDMPFKMSMFGKNKADSIIKKYNYESYYISGHSLGGVVASSYASSNDKIKGVILLASYSTKTIDNKKVLSIYGSNDGVMNKKEYENNKKNLPSDYKEVIISGGNHSQCGCYGFQKKDKKATISYFEQQKYIVDAIKEYF